MKQHLSVRYYDFYFTRGGNFEQLCSVRSIGVQRSTELHERLHDGLQVLQLLAREDQPRAEHHVQQVGDGHGEEQPVDLVVWKSAYQTSTEFVLGLFFGQGALELKSA